MNLDHHIQKLLSQCTICQCSYDISKEELEFLAKISPVFTEKKYQIPKSSLCPECRCQRRLAFRNERKLYPGDCDLCKKQIISMFHPRTKHKVYCHDCYFSEKWDAETYGRDFDSNKSFFDQFKEMNLETPQLALNVVSNENANYVNLSGYNKDCYLLFAGEYNESVYYADNTIKCFSCMDTSQTFDSEKIYDSIDIENCYNVFFSRNCKNCTDSMFLFNCIGCTDCIFSTNLRNGKYYIKNKQYSKEEYAIEKEKIINEIKSHKGLEKAKKIYIEIIEKAIHRASNKINVQNSTGDNLVNSKNCTNCFNDTKCEDLIHVWDGFDVKDVMDVNNTTEVELSYNAMSVGYNSYNVFLSYGCWTSSNIIYSAVVKNCKNLFGCTNMNSKSHCILNKKYSADEYESKVAKIIEHMIKTKEWGEFFPAAHSPFGFNESVAHEYFPLKKEEAITRGFNWAEHKTADQNIKTIKAEQVPDNIDDLSNSILEIAIECEKSGKPFKINKQELGFYRRHKLPIPRCHPDQRHFDRFKQRNPRKLWDRKCSKCESKIQTSYAPDRPETIYCEECYLKEVY